MNIPTHLSKLIANGTASFKTYVLGGSSSGIIPIPGNAVIIILKIVYKHFTDAPNLGDIQEVYQRSVHQLKVYSGKSENHFLINNTIRVENTVGIDSAIPYGNTAIDCFLVHTKGSIKFEIMRAPLPMGAITIDAPPATAQSLIPPIGFGNAVYGSFIPTVTVGNQGDGTGYQPYTRKLVPSGAAINFEGFEVANSAANSIDQAQLQNPLFSSARFPFLNISYIRIDKQSDWFIKSSS